MQAKTFEKIIYSETMILDPKIRKYVKNTLIEIQQTNTDEDC